MKNFFLLLLALAPLTALSAQTPFLPEEEARFQALEGAILPSTTKSLARAVFNPSANANQGSSTVNSGVQSLGVTLPAGALITNSYAYVTTPVVGLNSKVGFECEDANNILAQTDLTSKLAGQVFSLNQTGNSTVSAGANISSFNMTDNIAAQCNVSARISIQPVTAGKVVLFIEYVLTQ